jgi:hypothetical protein
MSASFSEFANRLLIALSKKPGRSSDLNEIAELNNLEYQEGWIARTSEYLNSKGLANVESHRDLQSGPDDDYHVVITGIGLAEAAKLQTCGGKILDKPSDEAVARIGSVTAAPRRIFLAHAHDDKLEVRKLYTELKARGFDPWLDEVDLMPGQIWKVEIRKAIRQAAVFLACLSSRSVEKVGYVQNEFRLALSEFGKRPPGSIFLVPVRLDKCDVPDLQIPDFGLSLQDIQWVDLWQEGGFDRLVGAIEHAFDAAALPKPSQEQAPTVIPAREQVAEHRAKEETRERARPAEAKRWAASEPNRTSLGRRWRKRNTGFPWSPR